MVAMVATPKAWKHVFFCFFLESDTRDQNHFVGLPARRLTVTFYVTFFVVISGSPRTPNVPNVPNVPK